MPLNLFYLEMSVDIGYICRLPSNVEDNVSYIRLTHITFNWTIFNRTTFMKWGHVDFIVIKQASVLSFVLVKCTLIKNVLRHTPKSITKLKEQANVFTLACFPQGYSVHDMYTCICWLVYQCKEVMASYTQTFAYLPLPIPSLNGSVRSKVSLSSRSKYTLVTHINISFIFHR